MNCEMLHHYKSSEEKCDNGWEQVTLVFHLLELH